MSLNSFAQLDSLKGSYTYGYETDSTEGGHLLLYPTSDSTILFHFDIFGGAPKYRMGTLVGEMHLDSPSIGRYTVVDSSLGMNCDLKFMLTKETVIVEGVNGNGTECGYYGYGIYSDGIYQRNIGDTDFYCYNEEMHLLDMDWREIYGIRKNPRKKDAVPYSEFISNQNSTIAYQFDTLERKHDENISIINYSKKSDFLFTIGASTKRKKPKGILRIYDLSLKKEVFKQTFSIYEASFEEWLLVNDTLVITSRNVWKRSKIIALTGKKLKVEKISAKHWRRFLRQKNELECECDGFEVGSEIETKNFTVKFSDTSISFWPL